MKNRILFILGTSLLPAFLLATFVILANPLFAETTAVYTVTNSADTDDTVCDANCTLREAINAANNAPGADTINFAIADNSTITLAGTQLPIITDTLFIDGNTAVSLTISGNDSSRIFEIGSVTAVTLTNLIISNGLITTTDPIADGGGIYVNLQARLILNDSTIDNNTASNSGGGLYNDRATVTINNSTFSNNQAENDGGGYYGEEANTTVNNSTFAQNNALDDAGGLINNLGIATINDSTFIANNSGDKAGGVYNRNVGAQTTINNSTIISNTAQKGAGLRNWQGTLTINNVTTMYNQATEEGGGIENFLGDVYIYNSTIAKNSALLGGGGIYNNGEHTGNPTVYNGSTYMQNSTLSDNSTPAIGGGLNLDEGGFVLTNTTIYSNSASQGGGMAIISGTISMTNSLIGGSQLSGGDCIISGTLGINTNNLIEDNSCSPALSGNAQVGPLADNGGGTVTHALLAGSPAIDAGNNVACPTTDQRGYLRLANDSNLCDIGAYETTKVLYLPIILKN